MKLYCTRGNKYNPLAQFVGKDIWVECYYLNPYGEPAYRYFKVESADATHSVVYSLMKRAVDHPDSYTVDVVYNAPRMYFDTDEISVIDPLEVYTTDELVDLFTTKKLPQQRLAGDQA